MALAEKIKSDPRLKKLMIWMITSGGGVRPRWWVRAFVNPFIHKRGRNTTIFRRARIDTLPFRPFELGNNVTIEVSTIINNGMGPVKIDDNSFIGAMNVIIGPVSIGKDIMTAQHVVMSGLNHGIENVSTPFQYQPCTTAEIVIGDGSWIGANSVITAGVKIGKYVVVGAGSVVTKDVPDYSIVAGNPARLLKQFNHTSGQWEKVSA